MPPNIVDITMPIVLCLSTLIPDASANLGLSPDASIAAPVLDFINSQIRKQSAPKKRSVPIGIFISMNFIFIKLSSTLSYLPAREIV